MSPETRRVASDRKPYDLRARVAVDLGAESCRVSVLRWHGTEPRAKLVHRIPNGPVHRAGGLFWPLERIIEGVQDGLRRAAEAAPEGIASIAVDGWAVDYVRLGPSGTPIADPWCYRDERTIAAKASFDAEASPEWLFSVTGAQPLRINTLYQLKADQAAGVDEHLRWLCLPEYVLYHLGGRPVAEYTNATHTGLLDPETGGWSEPVVERAGICRESLPAIVNAGAVIGKLHGAFTELPAFRDTDLIVPACHDTASAIAGIPGQLDDTVYLCSGTWSLIGTLVDQPIRTLKALELGFTNQGTTDSGFCFHSNVNGMWMIKQCLDTWQRAGRTWKIEDLVACAEACGAAKEVVQVSSPSLLLDGDMPKRLNEQLRLSGQDEIPDVSGNEGRFARLIFESLAEQYAITIDALRTLTGKDFKRVHILGGGSLNRLLTNLTAERIRLEVECGHVESSTMGNFAVQLAAAESGEAPSSSAIRKWALRLAHAQSGQTQS